ncbi:MAG: transglutaminase family protein [Myxococcales bacterium]|nr:transglutaminase family protein [Myxococcales bacterium]MBP6843706.1 transglutaminase family protein [Kofleriaceae bacterium]
MIDALAALDRAIAAAGVTIWIGAEPTYTEPTSLAPAWTATADGADADATDKRRRAAALALGLARGSGGQARAALGRQFPDEPAPRFCFEVAAAAITAAAPATDAAIAALLAAPPQAAPAPGALTVTPDPGVVEVNMAPCATLVEFHAQLAAIDAAAAAAGLAASRFRWNGEQVDSGGGGQLTIGGPTPSASPCFTHPALLPRLLRYVHNHPALSYWFMGEFAGSASQAPRPDEGVRERADELALACAELEHLAATGASTPARQWQTVAPILVDASGNPHRAELNVEKLWNPAGGARGCLGLIEWRAFRMAPSVDALVAAAALVRAVAARCAIAAYDAPWHDWGPALHHRWALPSELAADLDDVLADLADHGFDLAPLAPALASYRDRVLATAATATLAVTLRPAVEFWPLFGDVASQERAGARAVDGSTERIELAIATAPDAPAPRLVVAGRGVALTAHRPGHYRVGIRRRRFVPSPGFLPTVPADEPLRLTVGDAAGALAIEVYAWRPGGGPYAALPADAAEAAARRAARVAITPAAPPAWPARTVTATDTVDVRAWREEAP